MLSTVTVLLLTVIIILAFKPGPTKLATTASKPVAKPVTAIAKPAPAANTTQTEPQPPTASAPVHTSAPAKAPAPTHVSAPSYIVTNSLCQVDATQAPDQYERAKDMAAVCQTVFPQIEAMLTPSPYGPLHKIVLDYNQDAAYAWQGEVHVSIDWLHNSPYDPGLIPHELTHVIQDYGSNAPGWITEGIATYMSYKLHYSIGIAHCNSGELYTSGYGCGASLFNYIERVYRPSIVRDVHLSIKNYTYTDNIFKTETGKSLATLYSECLSHECAGGTP